MVMDSRGGTQTLTPALEACPRCHEPRGDLQPVRSALLDDMSLCRCSRCGSRFSAEPSPRLVPSCRSCGLPFLADAADPQESCVDCRDGRIPDDLPEGAVVEATEGEIRAVLAGSWRFVSAPALNAYLNRLASRVAGCVEGAPERSRVVLIDDASTLTLALPSGLVLMSVGALEGLEDEAELVFVLGHEVAHAAGGEAARRLVRLGLASVARENGVEEEHAWRGALRDMIVLGYGRQREHDADARSLQAFLALGYDPNSILRYLDRLEARNMIADPAVSELAMAHPTAAERMRRITRSLHGRTGSLPAKVNREVFRRAAGHEVLASELESVTLEEADAPSPESGTAPSRRRGLLWTALGIALVAALIIVAVLLLSG